LDFLHLLRKASYAIGWRHFHERSTSEQIATHAEAEAKARVERIRKIESECGETDDV
jgi:hypothetical protein